jgi:hypothetical protein
VKKLFVLAETFVEDVNKEDSAILGFYSILLDIGFKTLILFGVPFLLYVLIQFNGLL